MASIFGLAVGVASDKGSWVPEGSTVRLSTGDDVGRAGDFGVDVGAGGNVAAAGVSAGPFGTRATQADNSTSISAMGTARAVWETDQSLLMRVTWRFPKLVWNSLCLSLTFLYPILPLSSGPNYDRTGISQWSKQIIFQVVP